MTHVVHTHVLHSHIRKPQPSPTCHIHDLSHIDDMQGTGGMYAYVGIDGYRLVAFDEFNGEMQANIDIVKDASGFKIEVGEGVTKKGEFECPRCGGDDLVIGKFRCVGARFENCWFTVRECSKLGHGQGWLTLERNISDVLVPVFAHHLYPKDQTGKQVYYGEEQIWQDLEGLVYRTIIDEKISLCCISWLKIKSGNADKKESFKIVGNHDMTSKASVANVSLQMDGKLTIIWHTGQFTLNSASNKVYPSLHPTKVCTWQVIEKIANFRWLICGQTNSSGETINLLNLVDSKGQLKGHFELRHTHKNKSYTAIKAIHTLRTRSRHHTVLIATEFEANIHVLLRSRDRLSLLRGYIEVSQDYVQSTMVHVLSKRKGVAVVVVTACSEIVYFAIVIK